jgi:pimeloyl-ACP methyl ester carboxylesterase
MRRGLDYLMSRDDVDPNCVAFYGTSFAGPLLVLPAIESRYSAVMLLSAAIRKSHEQHHILARSIDFVPLIRKPTLLVHGRYDEANPLKSTAQPLYELLTGEKRMVTYEGAHWPDETGLVEPASTFLDDTFGPVRRD